MKSISYSLGAVLAFFLVLAAQGFIVMTATAFLAAELGLGAALSFFDSLFAALLFDVARLLFMGPGPNLRD